MHLEVVPIARRNQEVNLTAVVLPAEANLTVFYWWIGDNLQVRHAVQCFLLPETNLTAGYKSSASLSVKRMNFSPPQPVLTLQNSLLTRFPNTGEVSVTVQASNGRSMVKDTRIVRVYGNDARNLFIQEEQTSPFQRILLKNGLFLPPDKFHIIPVSFSRNLDRYNPNIPEWRDDVGQVVSKILSKVNSVDQLMLKLFMKDQNSICSKVLVFCGKMLIIKQCGQLFL